MRWASFFPFTFLSWFRSFFLPHMKWLGVFIVFNEWCTCVIELTFVVVTNHVYSFIPEWPNDHIQQRVLGQLRLLTPCYSFIVKRAERYILFIFSACWTIKTSAKIERTCCSASRVSPRKIAVLYSTIKTIFATVIVTSHSKSFIPISWKILTFYRIGLTFDLIKKVKVHSHNIALFNKVCSFVPLITGSNFCISF